MAKRRSKGEGTLWLDETNSRWMAQITLPTGKRRTKSGKNRKEVLDWLTEQRSKIKKGTYVTDESRKLGDFLTSYMKNTAIHNLRPRTYQTNEIYVRKHINPELGKIKLVSLRPHHLQKFYTSSLGYTPA